MLRTLCVAPSARRAVAEAGALRGFPPRKCSFLATESRRAANALPRYDHAAPNAIGWRNTGETPHALLHRGEALTVTCTCPARPPFVRVGIRSSPRAFLIYLRPLEAGVLRARALHVRVHVALRCRLGGWFLAAAGNVVRASLRENFARALHLSASATVDGQQNSTALHAAFVLFRLKFGHAHSDERASESPDHSACADSCERGDERAGSKQRADSRDGQRANASEHSQRAANHGASACAGGCAFRGFRIFYSADFRDAVAAPRRGIFVRIGVTRLVNARGSCRLDKRRLAEILRKEHRDVSRRESAVQQRVHGVFCAFARGINSKYRGLHFAFGHCVLLWRMNCESLLPKAAAPALNFCERRCFC